jgi:MFS family permease
MYEGLVRQSMANYFGYNGVTFGYLFALVSIPAILVTLGYDRLRKLLGDKKFLLLTLGLYTLGFSIASAGTGLVVGGIVYLIIMVTQGLARPIVSSLINERIDSKHRATTLSTLSLITQIPYIILVSFFAGLVEVQSIPTLMLGYALCLALVWSHTAVFVRD